MKYVLCIYYIIIYPLKRGNTFLRIFIPKNFNVAKEFCKKENNYKIIKTFFCAKRSFIII